MESRSCREVFDTTLCDKVCQRLATGQWFSPGTQVSPTNKTDHHDIAEILLKAALNTHIIILCFSSFRENSQYELHVLSKFHNIKDKRLKWSKNTILTPSNLCCNTPGISKQKYIPNVSKQVKNKSTKRYEPERYNTAVCKSLHYKYNEENTVNKMKSLRVHNPNDYMPFTSYECHINKRNICLI